MKYKRGAAVTDIITGTVLLLAYLIYALAINTPGADDIKGWATLMIIFILAGIGVAIVTHIIYHIVFTASVARKEQEDCCGETEKIISSEMIDDERDKQIRLRANNIGYMLVGAGIVIALVALVVDFSAVVGLNIIFVSVMATQIICGAISLNLYTKGV